jgi:hypothetical protein
MTDAERQRILDEAYANAARRDDDHAELLRRRNEADSEFMPIGINERERLERLRASLPVREQRLDIDIETLIAQRVAEAIAAERETMIQIVAGALAEALHEEHKAMRARLEDEVRGLRAELLNFEEIVRGLRNEFYSDAIPLNRVRRHVAA